MLRVAVIGNGNVIGDQGRIQSSLRQLPLLCRVFIPKYLPVLISGF